MNQDYVTRTYLFAGISFVFSLIFLGLAYSFSFLIACEGFLCNFGWILLSLLASFGSFISSIIYLVFAERLKMKAEEISVKEYVFKTAGTPVLAFGVMVAFYTVWCALNAITPLIF